MQSPFTDIKKRFQSQLTRAWGASWKSTSSPDELLGELFQDVQLRRVFPDGMTFVDLVPPNKLRRVLKAYEQQREQPRFDLHAFVQKYFKDYLGSPDNYHTNPNHTPAQHINELWNVLTRENYKDRGSLIALPYPYVVPGGRFMAQWYWDSYFTMLGLNASGRFDLVENMVKNAAYMVRKFGYIPTGNRTYYIGRSQPPFFAYMVDMLAERKGRSIYIRYLPYLLSEYRFWMKGSKQVIPEAPAYRRVVYMPDGIRLNRYYDNKRTPRPESYKEDTETALLARDRIASQVYLDLRAAAESGWDFSSRWLRDPMRLETIYTTELIPIDLNCLLYHLEQTIANTYRILKQPLLARRFEQHAAERAEAISAYNWSDEQGFYFDYDFVAQRQTESYTLAAVTPLFVKLASADQAAAVAKMLQEKFLKPGGLVTTLTPSAQQWDLPNGWAPLHWMAIQGLRNYGFDSLADEVKKRWTETCLDTYKAEGKLVEKYDVVNPHVTGGGGGEYPLQDGFGWTNGVLMALFSEEQRK